jgi:hypothetical protein
MFIDTSTPSKTAVARSEKLAPGDGEVLRDLGAINIWLLTEPGPGLLSVVE